MSDLMSRQELIKAIDELERYGFEITEKRKKGKWIDGFCSECHQEAITEWDDCGGEYALTRYCPNCGADMRGDKDE